MNLSKEAIIELSNKFPFSPFRIEAMAAGQDKGRTESGDVFASCENHRDDSFMTLLDQGAHLDIGRMPL